MKGISNFKCAYFDPVINNEIIETKKRFHNSSGYDLDSPYLLPEVLESWVRSKKNGVNPFAQLKELNTPWQDPSDLSVENKMLMEAAVPLIEKELSYLFTITGMCLSDKEGAILFTKKAARGVDKELHFKIGSVLREETIGTLSQTLCLEYLKPVQLFGAIHYHCIFENDLSSSVPIFDEA